MILAALALVALGAVALWAGPLDHGFPPPRVRSLAARSYDEAGRG